jgi:cellulose synthase/poly-beta-1,6-N-acetylglucosamine synthase-like glycosyltransferase
MVVQILKYITIFFGLYIQVFFLLNFLGWGEENEEKVAKLEVLDNELPTVAVIVPCYNEQESVTRTVNSLLGAHYPKNKLEILVVDDGSKDSTWKIVQQYVNNPQIKLYTKQNGGKYTALNYGLERTDADIVGCLDADSTINPNSIMQSVKTFLADKEAMAVVPAMTVENPKSFVQIIQKIEFESFLYMKKVFGVLHSLFVAPGPLTLFRKEVFEQLGPYRHGYLGEDLEIAVRMQFNHMKLVYADYSHVYTKGMPTLKTLLKQRVRWTYSFVNNMYDYKAMLFNPRYGHLGLFILPVTTLGLVLGLLAVPLIVYGLAVTFVHYVQPLFLGAQPSALVPHFDAFYITTNALPILGIITLIFAFAAIIIGRALNHERKQALITPDILSFLVYPFVSAWWTYKTLWKIIRSQQVTWR